MCVSLLPSDIGDIYAGIRRNIYQFLMRYNESLGGVLLAVSDLSFGDGAREGRIEDEMPHIHFDVKAKAQVFCPRPGHVLEGRVNKVGRGGLRKRNETFVGPRVGFLAGSCGASTCMYTMYTGSTFCHTSCGRSPSCVWQLMELDHLCTEQGRRRWPRRDGTCATFKS